MSGATALVLATRNHHKLREFARLLEPAVALEPLGEDVVLPPEEGATFAANALGKARAAAAATGRIVIADDSGIEAEALGGRPGVRSARYAGEHASDAQNLSKLMREVPEGGALRYVCALAYVEPGEGDKGAGAGPGAGVDPGAAPHRGGARERVFYGYCHGRLAGTRRGSGGFGYDPAFLPDARGAQTMAELSDVEKDAISHRGEATRALLAWLQALPEIDGR